jgi:hypothetical protein
MTDAQIEKMVEQRNAQMQAEAEARGAYFAATHERAISIGAGNATQAQYEEMMRLRNRWLEMRAA